MSGTAGSSPGSTAEDFAIARQAVPRAVSWRSEASVPSLKRKRSQRGWRRLVNPSGYGRRVLGLFMLALVVVLWTSANFVVSSVFADATYDKAYFFTWLTTSFFALTLIPVFAQKLVTRGCRRRHPPRPLRSGEPLLHASEDGAEESRAQEREIDPLNVDFTGENYGPRAEPRRTRSSLRNVPLDPLTLRETFVLAFKFCWIWFFSNWLNMGSLVFATVASATILTSTSGMWTLIVGAVMKVEPFTWRKLAGVTASVAGVCLISFMDVSGNSDKHRGTFPHKSRKEHAIGDAMALGGAILYGVYVTGLTKTIGDANRINMPMFFGFVGLLNMLCLWPGIVFFHYAGWETFLLPPTREVWGVILVTSAINLFSDLCWAYAILLTSPLVTTVGLSLTIPLSLIGQMVLESQYASPMYWLGATIVVASFIFINRQSEQEDVDLLEEREE